MIDPASHDLATLRRIIAGLRRRHESVLVAAAVLAIVAACAKKPPTAPPVIGAPHYPDFVYPAAPAGLGTAATVERHKAGWEWLQAGDLHAADRNFSASLKLSPNFYPAEVGLGYSALARKEYEPALLHFDKAIVENPRYAPALVGRGDALLASNQREGALQSFEAALAADPGLVDLRSRIEVLRLGTLRDDVAEARKAAQAGRLAEARKAYQDAIAASPQSQFLYRELGGVEKQDGDLAAALVHAQKAAELDPSDAQSHILVGEILEARGDLTAAGDAYRAAEAIDPSPSLTERIEKLRERMAADAMPEEFKAIEGSPTVTRAQLAALIGVRLEPLLLRSVQSNAVVITDTRGNWAAPWILSVARAGVMEVYPNHTFQPSAVVTRGDLAAAASRALSVLAKENPSLSERWRNASRRRFQDVSPLHLSYPAVSLTVEAGVMTPGPDGNFQLSRPATGAEASDAVKRLEALAIATRR